MTRAQLHASRAKWQRREDYRRRKWRAAKPHTARRSYWFAALKRAKRMRERRDKQIAALGVTEVSPNGLRLIKAHEGFRANAYLDPVGVRTKGYGETRNIDNPPGPWSEAYASKRLARRVNRDYLAPVLKIAKQHGVKLKQHEADALASFSYNLGPGVFAQGTSIGNALRSGNRTAIAAAILLYDKAGGRALPGLTRRRREERALFLGGK